MDALQTRECFRKNYINEEKKEKRYEKKLFMMAVGVIMGAVAAFGMIPAQAKAVRPVFTGDKNVDYIAEKMVKSAGVKKT